MRYLFAAVILVGLMAVPFAVSNADSGDDCLCIGAETVRKYCEAENAGIKKNEYQINQEKIAKRDIQKAINHGINADIAKDSEARSFIETEDLTIKTLEGEIFKGKETNQIGAATNNYQGILSISDDTKISVECLSLNGREATVYTNQHFVRYVPDRKDGSPHEVITNIIHRETWIFTENGWKVKYIEELERGKTYLDGKLFDPES